MKALVSEGSDAFARNAQQRSRYGLLQFAASVGGCAATKDL